MKVKVGYNQNLIDIALTNYGSQWISGVLAIIEANDVSLADVLTPGQELELPDASLRQAQGDLSLQYLKARGIVVATGGTGDEEEGVPNLVDENYALLIDEQVNELVYE